MKRFRTMAAGVVSAVVLLVMTACGSSASVEMPEEMHDQQVEQEPQAAFDNENVATGQASAEEAYAYLETVVQNTDEMWKGYFDSVGAEYPSFYYVIVREGESFQSACMKTPTESTYQNAFFCPTDSTVVLPLGTFMNMWNGDIFGKSSLQAGDFAAATIVMHEVAHSVVEPLAEVPGATAGQPAGSDAYQVHRTGRRLWCRSGCQQCVLRRSAERYRYQRGCGRS